jgi:hypothetical protein
MKKFVSIIRIAILFVVFTFAIVLILGEETGNGMFGFFQIIIDKALGLAAFWLFVKLYKHWHNIDPWLMAYEKFCSEIKDAHSQLNVED